MGVGVPSLETHCIPTVSLWKFQSMIAFLHDASVENAACSIQLADHQRTGFGALEVSNIFEQVWVSQSLYNMSPRTEFRANSAQKRQISVEGPGDAVTGRIQRKQVTVAVYSICLYIYDLILVSYVYIYIYTVTTVYLFNIYIYLY